MYQALMERQFELPVIGRIAKRQAFGESEEVEKGEEYPEHSRIAGAAGAPHPLSISTFTRAKRMGEAYFFMVNNRIAPIVGIYEKA